MSPLFMLFDFRDYLILGSQNSHGCKALLHISPLLMPPTPMFPCKCGGCNGGRGWGERKKQRGRMKINTLICLPFSLINCRATSFWNISKLSVSSFMWKSIRKGSPSSVNSCIKKYSVRIIRPLHSVLAIFQVGTILNPTHVTCNSCNIPGKKGPVV